MSAPAATFSKRLRKELASWVLKESMEKARPLLSQVLTYHLEVQALRIMEKDGAIQELLWKDSRREKGRGGFSADRQQWVRSYWVRFLMRAGHYGLVRQALARFSDGSAESLFQQALIAYEFWDFETSRSLLVEATRRTAATPEMQIARYQLEARCRFVARQGREEIPALLAEIERWLPKLVDEDRAGAVTARYADVLGMSGQNTQARSVCVKKAEEVEERIRQGIPSSLVNLAELYVGAARYSSALKEPREVIETYLNRSLELSKEERDNYPLMLTHLFDAVRARLDSGAGAQLLSGLQGHLVGFDPARLLVTTPGTHLVETHSLDPAGALRHLVAGVRLRIDLATDEYRFLEEETPRLGCPLEVKLIAWIALASPLVSMPRTLLLDLLWPNMPAEVIHLQDRLSKLLLRAERIYGIPLRNGVDGELRIAVEDLPKIQVVTGAPGAVPSFFRVEKKPNGVKLGQYYGLSKSQAAVWMARARELGWVEEASLRPLTERKAA